MSRVKHEEVNGFSSGDFTFVNPNKMEIKIVHGVRRISEIFF